MNTLDPKLVSIVSLLHAKTVANQLHWTLTNTGCETVINKSLIEIEPGDGDSFALFIRDEDSVLIEKVVQNSKNGEVGRLFEAAVKQSKQKFLDNLNRSIQEIGRSKPIDALAKAFIPLAGLLDHEPS